MSRLGQGRGRRARQSVQSAQAALGPVSTAPKVDSPQWKGRLGLPVSLAFANPFKASPGCLAKPSRGCESGRPAAARRLGQSVGVAFANLRRLAQAAFPSLRNCVESGRPCDSEGGVAPEQEPGPKRTVVVSTRSGHSAVEGQTGAANGRSAGQLCMASPGCLAKPLRGCELGRPTAARRLGQPLGVAFAKFRRLAQAAFPSLRKCVKLGRPCVSERGWTRSGT